MLKQWWLCSSSNMLGNAELCQQTCMESACFSIVTLLQAACIIKMACLSSCLKHGPAICVPGTLCAHRVSEPAATSFVYKLLLQ